MGGKLYDKRHVVRLNAGPVCGFVSQNGRAFLTRMYYYIALLGVCNRRHRLHKSAARVCPVSRIDVHMQRPKTKRTVVSRSSSERFDGFPTIQTDKALVIFSESLIGHCILIIHSQNRLREQRAACILAACLIVFRTVEALRQTSRNIAGNARAYT